MTSSRRGSRRVRRRWLRTAARGWLAASLMLFAPPRSVAAEVEGIEPAVERLEVQVLSTSPHDRAAYTQGLLWHEGSLFESTGQYGESTLRRVSPESGEVAQGAALPDDLFGEGLARVGDRLIQLTWKEGKALVWSLDRLELLTEIPYQGQGWGLCHDGSILYMSDGTDRLTLRDPRTFAVLRRIGVSLSGRPVSGLNELECAEGWIYANLYGSDMIVRIDPSSGRISAVIDASGLLADQERAVVDVLNGIAYRPDRGTFLLTGKYWPRVFEVVFIEASRSPEPAPR